MTTTTSSPSAVIAVAEPVFTSAGHLALAGFRCESDYATAAVATVTAALPVQTAELW